MSDLVNVVVYGSAGRMGQAIIRVVLDSTQARLSCALVRPGSGLADEPLDRVFGALERNVDFSTSLDPDVPCDVLVDFSGRMRSMGRLRSRSSGAWLSSAVRPACATSSGCRSNTRLARYRVVGGELQSRRGDAAAGGPSRRNVTADWDCDIVEFHHKRKTDAPSGPR
jgi:4-hydroxy-tetrahydrodipicolinate reductase